MSAKPANPPAFPSENERQTGPNSYYYEGMTLRDYFAAAALTGLLQQGYDKFVPMEWAAQAYTYADAMLVRRQK